MRVQCNSSSNESLKGFVFQEVMQTMEAVRISGLEGQVGMEKGRLEAQVSLLLSPLIPSLGYS